jgi:hypothetical protein
MAPQQLLAALARASVHSQQLLVLVTNVTLESPQLLTQGTMVSTHVLDIHLQGLDLTCIHAEMTTLSCNGALGGLLQLEHVLGISRHVRPTAMVVVMVDVARPIDARLSLRIGVVLNLVERDGHAYGVR